MHSSQPPSNGNEGQPKLEFDHNVIEHLGIKLYQNKPANVLAELVSNSWDADARAVFIDVTNNPNAPDRIISVSDSGSGMTLPQIKERYLVIGKQKRSKPGDRSPVLNRAPMGRKGIGKLAPFGIASRIDVATMVDGTLNWFTLNLDELAQKAIEKQYYPTFHIMNGSIADLERVPSGAHRDLILSKFQNMNSQSGTVVAMSGMRMNTLPTREDILAKLVSRFTVLLSKEDFKVSINDEELTSKEALPEFEFRIPQSNSPFATETVGGHELNFGRVFLSQLSEQRTKPVWGYLRTGK